MIESIVICRHDNLGYTASLRFSDKSHYVDISSNDKRSLNRKIDYIVMKELKTNDKGATNGNR